jgi:hypothetical protein
VATSFRSSFEAPSSCMQACWRMGSAIVVSRKSALSS